MSSRKMPARGGVSNRQPTSGRIIARSLVLRLEIGRCSSCDSVFMPFNIHGSPILIDALYSCQGDKAIDDRTDSNRNGADNHPQHRHSRAMLSRQWIDDPVLAISSRAGTAGQTHWLECGRLVWSINRVPGILVGKRAHVGQIMSRLPETVRVGTCGTGNENESFTRWQLHVLTQHRVWSLLRPV